MDALVARHLAEREQKVNLIRSYAIAAEEEARDLTETEIETITKARARVAELDRQIETIAVDLAMTDTAKDKIRSLAPAIGGNGPSYRSAGELLYDVLHQSDDDARARYQRVLRRAAEHMGTDAANTMATAGDLGGLVVKPVVGPIIYPSPLGSPLATAVGLIEAPNGLHFMRPRVVDPDAATGVGPQGSGASAGKEKAELPSKKFDVTADPIALATIGGYLNISQQLLSLQPGSLDLILRVMNNRLARAIDRAVLAEMVRSTGKVTLAANADAATILKAVFDASAAVYEATGELASWVAMGPKGWARLGSLVDAAGRPMFPYLGAANALGQADASTFAMAGPAGLRPVVTPAITDATFWVGNGMVAEAYIYRFPVLEAVEPSVLGRQVAVAAAIAGYRPVADGAIHLAP
jgi:HK97 family phage major capsid protein